ncbi:hypothetical protein GCM10028832_11990 [Streptomyces sparsus]
MSGFLVTGSRCGIDRFSFGGALIDGVSGCAYPVVCRANAALPRAGADGALARARLPPARADGGDVAGGSPRRVGTPSVTCGREVTCGRGGATKATYPPTLR